MYMASQSPGGQPARRWHDRSPPSESRQGYRSARTPRSIYCEACLAELDGSSPAPPPQYGRFLLRSARLSLVWQSTFKYSARKSAMHSFGAKMSSRENACGQEYPASSISPGTATTQKLKQVSLGAAERRMSVISDLGCLLGMSRTSPRLMAWQPTAQAYHPNLSPTAGPASVGELRETNQRPKRKPSSRGVRLRAFV